MGINRILIYKIADDIMTNQVNFRHWKQEKNVSIHVPITYNTSVMIKLPFCLKKLIF